MTGDVAPSSRRVIFLATLRDANWINRDRMRAYVRVLALGLIVVGAGRWVWGGDFAADFRSFWAASALALQGRPASAYDPFAHNAVEVAIPGHWHGGWAAFFYPPIYLFACLPLALLPFGASALAWTVATGGLFAASIRPLIPRGGWLAAAAYPANWLNAGSGQNGFLTAGLLIFGLRWMDSRPFAAGAMLGCLAFKPQFAVVLPFAVIASGRWRVAVAGGVTLAVLVCGSIAAFGVECWAGFLRDLPLARMALDIGAEKPANLISVLGAALLLGCPTAAALTAQTIAAACACLTLTVYARRCDRPGPLSAAVCVCALLASPWAHYYDLTILALPLAWLVAEGLRDGFRPWERLTLFVGYALPLFSISLAMLTHIPIAPLVLTAMLALIWRRSVAPLAGGGEAVNRG